MSRRRPDPATQPSSDDAQETAQATPNSPEAFPWPFITEWHGGAGFYRFPGTRRAKLTILPAFDPLFAAGIRVKVFDTLANGHIDVQEFPFELIEGPPSYVRDGLPDRGFYLRRDGATWIWCRDVPTWENLRAYCGIVSRYLSVFSTI